MAQLHKFVKNTSVSQKLFRRVVGDRTYNNFHPIGASLENAAKVPTLPTPIVMPDPEDDALKKARKRSLAAAAQRSGFASTVLSDSSNDPLGG